MEVREGHTLIWEIMNDWYCDSSYMILSSALWNLENFRGLIFVVESVRCMTL